MDQILLSNKLSKSNLYRLIDALNNPKNIEILELFIATYFNIPKSYIHNKIYLVKKNHHNDKQVSAVFVRPDPLDMILLEIDFKTD